LFILYFSAEWLNVFDSFAPDRGTQCSSCGRLPQVICCCGCWLWWWWHWQFGDREWWWWS